MFLSQEDQNAFGFVSRIKDTKCTFLSTDMELCSMGSG